MWSARESPHLHASNIFCQRLRQGSELLRFPDYNKGSAFPIEERDRFELHNLLPSNIQTLEEQVQRAYKQYSTRPDDLAKNTFMTSMKEQNTVLYFKVWRHQAST